MQLLDLDYTLFKILNGLTHKSVFWDTLFIFFAEYLIYLMIAGLALFVFIEKKRVRVAAEALVSAFLSRAIFTSVIRAFLFRPRPFVSGTVVQLIPHSPLEGSFPSGHAAFMFAMAFTLLLKNKPFGYVYLALALLTGVARIIVGIHFPLDIVGGLLVGLLAALAVEYGQRVWKTCKNCL